MHNKQSYFGETESIHTPGNIPLKYSNYGKKNINWYACILLYQVRACTLACA